MNKNTLELSVSQEKKQLDEVKVKGWRTILICKMWILKDRFTSLPLQDTKVPMCTLKKLIVVLISPVHTGCTDHQCN